MLIEKKKGSPIKINSERIYDLRYRVKSFNESVGDLTDYECKFCKNKGVLAVLVDNEMTVEPCKCVKVRNAIRNLKTSGINQNYQLNTFTTEEVWQKAMLNTAWKFVKKPTGWFYAGGQVGCGKTHICTGIVRELLQKGYPAKYMIWREESVKIKAVVGKPEEYEALVKPLKTIDVLYIDDFWKTNADPTTADINLAFEIINARYNKPELITIISSEYFVDELADIDEAVGSRIFEQSVNFQLNISRSQERNYRLKCRI